MLIAGREISLESGGILPSYTAVAMGDMDEVQTGSPPAIVAGSCDATMT